MTEFEVRLLEHVRGIRVALETWAAPVAAVPAATACTHPEDGRVDFGVTDGQPDWQCGTCGYRSVETKE